jgi:hypothetical protein
MIWTTRVEMLNVEVGVATDREPRTLLKPLGRRSTPTRTGPTHPAQCAYKIGRAVFDESHNRQTSSTRRLVFEVTYSL